MNHIARLIHERDELRAQLRSVQDDLGELVRYLASDKFRWPENDCVHVRTDILPKLMDAQFRCIEGAVS